VIVIRRKKKDKRGKTKKIYLLLGKHLFPFFIIQVDENVPQQQSSPSSSVIVTTPDDNGSLSTTITSITTATTTKTDDRASPLNHHTLRKKAKRQYLQNKTLINVSFSHFDYIITQNFRLIPQH
jgi:hypothetical protein